MNSYNLQSQGPKNSVAGYFSQQNVLFGFRIRTFGIKKKTQLTFPYLHAWFIIKERANVFWQSIDQTIALALL